MEPVQPQGSPVGGLGKGELETELNITTEESSNHGDDVMKSNTSSGLEAQWRSLVGEHVSALAGYMPGLHGGRARTPLPSGPPSPCPVGLSIRLV